MYNISWLERLCYVSIHISFHPNISGYNSRVKRFLYDKWSFHNEFAHVFHAYVTTVKIFDKHMNVHLVSLQKGAKNVT